MRGLLAAAVIFALSPACSDMSSTDAAPQADAALTPRDARTASADAAAASVDAPRASVPDAMIEDLDMTLQDFANIQGFMTPTGRSYRVANLLGHETAALAAAASATGGKFPVGSIVEVQDREAMVKRRSGFDPTTNDWEFFQIQFASDMTTPQAFTVRGTESTACFNCHMTMSSVTWDFMCEHP